jgi:uncharacterized membrane protein YhaH (DUF805 family)
MPHYGISFGGAIARGFKKYATFTGRASRSEFWWFGLFTNLVAIASPSPSPSPLSSRVGETKVKTPGLLALLLIILYAIFALGIIVPALALTVRRLHDAGYSGLLVLLGLIPYLGSLIMLIFVLLPSSPAGVKYDPITATPDPYGPYPPQNLYPG